MSKKVVLDNCVMAWAFKSQLTESHDAKTIQAQRLIEKIDKEGDELVIPSVVLFEFLSIFDKDERDQRESFLRELLSSIKICNYGYECAKYEKPDEAWKCWRLWLMCPAPAWEP